MATPRPSRTPKEQAFIESVDRTLKEMVASLKSLNSTIPDQLGRANKVFADLQRRVSALEQRQGVAEPKPAAQSSHRKTKR
jgi:hypothetical protein